MKIFLIRCSTGCTCCSDMNHYRGPYKSREDAERRISFFLKPDSRNNPLASRYAEKGRYEVMEEEVEEISGCRIILWGETVKAFNGFVYVQDDGLTAVDDCFMGGA